jgi:hypothetical protein
LQLSFFADPSEAQEALHHLSDRSVLALVSETENIRNNLASNPNLKGVLAMIADTLLQATQN